MLVMKRLKFRHSNVINFALVAQWITRRSMKGLVNNGNTPAFLGALWLYSIIRRYMITRDIDTIIKIRERLKRDNIKYSNFPAYCGAYSHKVNIHKGYIRGDVGANGIYWDIIVKVLDCIMSEDQSLWNQTIRSIEMLEARHLKASNIETIDYDRNIAWNPHTSYATLFGKPRIIQVEE